MKSRVVLASLSLLVCLAAIPCLAEFDEGLEFFRKGQYAKALEHLTPAATRNEPRAQVILGHLYEHGRGVEQDLKAAASWYLRAAKNGSAEGQCRVGEMYQQGRGVALDPERGAKWIMSAAKDDHTRAMHEIAIVLRDGRGMASNEKQAFKWFAKAAEKGWGESQYELAKSYAEGRGVSQDDKAAVEWAEKVAFRPHAAACMLLAELYLEGRGAPANPRLARRLLGTAAAHLHPGAEAMLESVEQITSGSALDRTLAEDAYKKGWYATAAYEWQRQARRGKPDAQFRLARSYVDGFGVVQDTARAYQWAALAAGWGHRQATELVVELSAVLGDEQRAEADQAQFDWRQIEWAPMCPDCSTLPHASDKAVEPPWVIPETRVEPHFPQSAQTARTRGLVTLEAVVSRDGSVRHLRVLSSDNPAKYDFENSALTAVRQWRYLPAKKDGEPVDILLTIPITFEPK